MIELTTMTVRLIGSKPDGIRICHVEGESLTTVVVPCELLSEAKRLPDIPKRGVYYLLDEDHGIIGRVYAGADHPRLVTAGRPQVQEGVLEQGCHVPGRRVEHG